MSAPPTSFNRRPQRFIDSIAALRVLVVDDTAFSRDLIGAYLKEAGLESIVYAGDGLEAIEAVHEHSPDLVILDIMMPGIDGFEVCRRLRADPATAELPILVQTALTSSEDRNKAFLAGATDLVPKPIDPNELLSRVRIHLENRQLIGDLRNYRMRVEGELEIARSMYEHLLPSEEQCRAIEAATGVTINRLLHTGTDFCGDFWGLVPLEGRRFGVFIADTPVRGLAAALASFRLHTLVSEALPLAEHPGEFLQELNERAVTLRETGGQASIGYGIVDVDAATFIYATAASAGPVLLSGNPPRCSVGEATGLPVSIAPTLTYRERLIPFPPGSALILHSNAVLDAMPGGVDGLTDLLIQTATLTGIGHAFPMTTLGLETRFAERPADDHTVLWLARTDDADRR